jgi:hypothetical protein
MSDINETPIDPLSPDAIEAVIEASTFTLSYFPEKLAIVNLAPGAEVPRWAEASSLFSITATATETSLICATRSIPAKTPAIKPLTAFVIKGPLDPELVGVLAKLLTPLADAGIPAFPLSTFQTDWILVPINKAEAAAEEWRRQGHTVLPAVPMTPPKTQPRKTSPDNAGAGKK